MYTPEKEIQYFCKALNDQLVFWSFGTSLSMYVHILFSFVTFLSFLLQVMIFFLEAVGEFLNIVFVSIKKEN